MIFDNGKNSKRKKNCALLHMTNFRSLSNPLRRFFEVLIAVFNHK